jgi:hypothetical protein
LKIKLKVCHFGTVEVIEADFQDAFKNDRSAGIGAYAWKGTTSRLRMTSRQHQSRKLWMIL